MLDPEIIGLLTRVTARLSAATLASYFILRGLGPLSWRPRMLMGFITAHTVHFAMVMTLAVATRGENISVRGGWLPIGASGLLFYVTVLLAWYVEQSETRGRSMPLPGRVFRGIILFLLWSVFAHAYLPQVGQSWWSGLLALMLAGGIVSFAVSLFAPRK